MLLDDFDEVQAVGRAAALRQARIRVTRLRVPRFSCVDSRTLAVSCATVEERVRGVRPVAALAADQPHLTRGARLRRPAPRPAGRCAISVSAQRRGSSATPSFISTARLMPSRLGSAITMLSGDVLLLEQPQHALARRRRIVVRDDRSRAPNSSIVTCLAAGERVRRRHEQHELVGADGNVEQARFGRLERQRRRSRGCPAALRRAICRAGTRRTSTAMSGCCCAEARR